jgi:arylsulfatase A-like enzyme
MFNKTLSCCMRQPIRLFIVVCCFLFAFLMSNAQEHPDRPNIIFILADDLGMGDVSCFNKNGKIKTPNIDKISKNGILFTDAHSSAAVCTPTRYGLLTGRYNWRSRLKEGVLLQYDKPLMEKGRTNMASMLKTKGYQTAAIGKWHLGWNWPTTNGKPPVDNKDECNLDFSMKVTGGPTSIGFDYFFGIDAPNYSPYTYIENDTIRGTPSVFYTSQPYADCRPGIGVEGWNLEHIMPDLKQASVRYISKASSIGQPFFLYLPITAPHTPIAPGKSFIGSSGLNVYADFVKQVDDFVGSIQQSLKEHHLTENTILVFASDNGCSPQADFKFLKGLGHDPNNGYRGHKADIFEGGHRVPLLVQWPKKIKQASTVSQTVSLNDFMATFASIVNYDLKDNEAEDSYDLLPVLLKPNVNHIIREATVHHSVNGSFAIRKGDWKLIFTAGSGGWSFPAPGKAEEGLPSLQLYNLSKDPAEKNNCYHQFPQLVEELTTLIKKYIQEGRSTPGTPQKNDGEYPWKQLNFLK